MEIDYIFGSVASIENEFKICYKEIKDGSVASIENIRIIQKGQIIGSNNNASTFENFKMLMAA